MIERKEVNRLVVATMGCSDCTWSAVQLYDVLRQDYSSVLRQERVRGFRSFVKIMNQSPLIGSEGTHTKKYFLLSSGKKLK